MPAPLNNRFRNALVTGASRGIGAAVAARLVAEGVETWGTSRDPARIASPLRAARLDLGDGPGAVAAAVAAIDSDAGGLDLIVHNAAQGVFGCFGSTELQAWSRQIGEIAVSGAAVLHAGLRAIESRGRGVLVGVTSLAVEFPIPFMSGYNAGKAAQAALLSSLILETAGSDIKVLDFRAGDHRTGFNDSMQKGDDPKTSAAWERNMELIRAAPAADRAADDLMKALRRGRRGIVRSGGLFQARIAPFLAHFAPRSLQLAAIRRYYRLS